MTSLLRWFPDVTLLCEPTGAAVGRLAVSPRSSSLQQLLVSGRRADHRTNTPAVRAPRQVPATVWATEW